MLTIKNPNSRPPTATQLTIILMLIDTGWLQESDLWPRLHPHADLISSTGSAARQDVFLQTNFPESGQVRMSWWDGEEKNGRLQDPDTQHTQVNGIRIFSSEFFGIKPWVWNQEKLNKSKSLNPSREMRKYFVNHYGHKTQNSNYSKKLKEKKQSMFFFVPSINHQC